MAGYPTKLCLLISRDHTALQCTNSYWVTTPSFTQRQWPPCWELQSFCWDSQLANRVLPGAWHTLWETSELSFPSIRGKATINKWRSLGSPAWDRGLTETPRRSRNDPRLPPAHSAMVENPSKSNGERGSQQFRSTRNSCCVKWGGICLQATQSLFILTGRMERFFSYLSSAVLSRLENRFKRIRIWFLNTHSIKLFSLPIII